MYGETNINQCVKIAPETKSDDHIQCKFYSLLVTQVCSKEQREDLVGTSRD